MKTPLMIGVCGGSWGDGGVGKTTVVNTVTKSLHFYPVSFVEPVKDIAKKFFQWNGTMNPDARVLLNNICRMGRSISEDYWRDLTVTRIPQETKRVIFDDVWFPNEAKMIASNGGIMIRVLKAGYESPVLPCEMLDIFNDGSLADLQTRTSMLVAHAMALNGLS